MRLRVVEQRSSNTGRLDRRARYEIAQMAQATELTEGQQAGKAFHDSLQSLFRQGSELSGADQPHCDAFQCEFRTAGLNKDIFVIGVLGDQLDAIRPALETLDE